MANSANTTHEYLDELKWDDISDLAFLTSLFSLTLDQELAHKHATEILSSLGSLGQVVQRPPGEVRELIPSCPEVAAFISLLRLGVHRIVNEHTLKQTHINSPTSLARYIAINRNPSAAGDRRIVLLDSDGRLIRDFSMALRMSNTAVCHNIAKEALRANAFGVIVIDYTYDDKRSIPVYLSNLETSIKQSIEKININLYDYCIVGLNKFYSKKNDQLVNIN